MRHSASMRGTRPPDGFRRRHALAGLAVAPAVGMLAGVRRTMAAPAPGGAAPGPVCFFSKFLPDLAPGPMAKVLKAIGYDGVDLTVRPGGHIEPALAAAQLPAAVAAIQDEGLTVPIATTALVSAKDPHARDILKAAGQADIPMFKPGYWNYEYRNVRQELASVGRAVRGLTHLGRRYGVRLGFHNHGGKVGGAMWDALQILDPLPPRWAGYYFDTRHAFAEGGQSAWKVASHLLGARVIAVSVKDFLWEKTSTREWKIRKVPLGEGMVDIAAILTILRERGFAGPISLHLEYPIEGGQDAVLAAAERDLGRLTKILAQVYS